jgi:acyl-CoA thioester hydrolase
MTPELENGHFVARKIVAEYFKPAKLGDVLDIKTELLEMRNASFSLKQGVFREGEKLFELEITLAYISFEGRPQKLKDVKDFILDLFKV